MNLTGLVTLWDTIENRCVMYWKTGASEIGQLPTVPTAIQVDKNLHSKIRILCRVVVAILE